MNDIFLGFVISTILNKDSIEGKSLNSIALLY